MSGTKAVVTLIHDKRKIDCVEFDEGGQFVVGEKGITKIIPYSENGEMAPIPWIAVYQGDDILARFPARMVSIHYERKNNG